MESAWSLACCLQTTAITCLLHHVDINNYGTQVSHKRRTFTDYKYDSIDTSSMILDSIIPHILFGVPNRRSFHIYRYWQSRLFDLLQTIYFSFTRVCVKKNCRASILWPRAIPSHANPRILRIASLWGHVWGHYLRSWVKKWIVNTLRDRFYHDAIFKSRLKRTGCLDQLKIMQQHH